MIPLVLKTYLMLLNRFFVIFIICLTSCVSLDSTFPANLSFKKNVDDKFIKAAKNISNLDILSHHGLNVYDIIKRDNLIIIDDALKLVEERLL